MRNCPYPRCGKEIPDHLFECRSHWHELDAEQQADIHDAYRRYQAGELRLAELRAAQENITGWNGRTPPPPPAPRGRDVVLCRSCKARMFWATTEAGATMPVDADPVPDGNLFDRDGVMVAASLLNPAPAGVPLFKSHFASCVNAAKHRRAK